MSRPTSGGHGRGGGAATLGQTLRATGPGGVNAMIGVVTGTKAALNRPVVAIRETRIEAVTAGSRAAPQKLVEAMAMHGTKPVADRATVALDTLRDGPKQLRSGRHAGKVGGARRVTPNPGHAALHAVLRDTRAPGGRRLTMGFGRQPLFLQGAGVAQGGALAAMPDFAMAFCGMAAAGADHGVATTSPTTTCLAAATGSDVRARAGIGKAGRRVIHERARRDGGGRPVATASSTLPVL